MLSEWVMESERVRVREKIRERKRKGGEKIKVDYLELVFGFSEDGRKPVFSFVVFIKASLQGNQDQLKITS